MVVYVILNSKFKEHFVQIFQDIGKFLGCKRCKARCLKQEDPLGNGQWLPLNGKTANETKLLQATPKLSRDFTDTRAPVFV